MGVCIEQGRHGITMFNRFGGEGGNYLDLCILCGSIGFDAYTHKRPVAMGLCRGSRAGAGVRSREETFGKCENVPSCNLILHRRGTTSYLWVQSSQPKKKKTSSQ